MNLTLRRDVSATDTEDGMVLLDEQSGSYWQLNSTAALILRTLLDGTEGTPERAARVLTERYPAVSAELAATDVAALIDSLSTARLVVTGG
ncbi:lasso peptide biosynthesis PqqD family chaperone [Streptomyces telluris]|uniref:Lasso peptide biosynthesis PqqD family chaperone n=1 Tax=Streptomyces telluris TaxID=2720021 RepID=A0A9X2LK46_9ACTN|nr:lasso peptide biosynthesis PqqD family chaperone [Streptomyces telluris]MCQ8772342.1 lasso peptide biosynthesis PqqD family chaperone [Streptomyces telluris]NJP81208.1 lasso peptide biosynthesis PqqD family chaperone [Streptomyces telluris]